MSHITKFIKLAQEVNMLFVMFAILFLAASVEITGRVNNPAEARVRIDSYKFHPEFGHIHECESGC
jgi:hypothetical protein